MKLDTQMTIRMTKELYKWLQQDAQGEFRSLNAQVIAILESYRKQKEQQKNDADNASKV